MVILDTKLTHISFRYLHFISMGMVIEHIRLILNKAIHIQVKAIHIKVKAIHIQIKAKRTE